MAKVVAAEPQAAPAKGGKLGWVVIAVVCLLAVGGGLALPLLLNFDGHAAGAGEPEKKTSGEPKQALISFGDVVVNVATGTYTRYLKVKIMVVVDEKDEKTVKELLDKKKPWLQNWVTSYLSDRTLDELHGSAGKNRARREIRDQFNAMLFPDGSEKITDLLMPEFYFQ